MLTGLDTIVINVGVCFSLLAYLEISFARYALVYIARVTFVHSLMKNRYSGFTSFLLLAGDLTLLNLWVVLAGLIRFQEELLFEFSQEYYKTLFVTLNLVWLVVTFAFNSYSFLRGNSWVSIIRKTLNALFFHFLFIAAFIVFLKGYNFSRLYISYLYGGFLVSVVLWRTLFNVLLRYYRKKGFNYRVVALVGDGPLLVRFFKEIISNKDFGYRLLGHFGVKPMEKLNYLGTLEDLEALPKAKLPDVVFCSYIAQDERIKELSTFCDRHMIRFRYIPNLQGLGARRYSVEFMESTPVLVERPEPLQSFFNQLIKGTFDSFISLCVVLFIFPWFIPLIALLIKIDSKGPIFFIQQRSGLRNEVIKCIKFRTMYHDSKVTSKRKLQAVEGDERITPMGAFLRKTNLDEMPQFFNVLRGEMSVVGPRPHMLAHTKMYSKLVDQFMVRHLIKPGITGLAQVNGYRGETKTTEDMENRVKYDVLYLENWSVLLDIKIVVKTILNMIKGDDNAH